MIHERFIKDPALFGRFCTCGRDWPCRYAPRPALKVHGYTVCEHPRAETVRRLVPAHWEGYWAKSRVGGRWVLRREPQPVPDRAVFVMTCPDCPATAYALDSGALRPQLTLPIWLTKVETP